MRSKLETIDDTLGRTLETYRILLESEQSFWLKKTKKTNFEYFMTELLNQAQKYADVGTFWGFGLIKEKILFSILFSQYKELLKS